MFLSLFLSLLPSMFPPWFPTSGERHERHTKRKINEKGHLKKGCILKRALRRCVKILLDYLSGVSLVRAAVSCLIDSHSKLLVVN